MVQTVEMRPCPEADSVMAILFSACVSVEGSKVQPVQFGDRSRQEGWNAML